MRIGVVSDTHNHLANVARIVALLNRAGVERVVHTGDVTQARTLQAFAGLEAPLFGVFGNNDERGPLEQAARALGFALADGPLELHWAGRRIVVVHDPRALGDVVLRSGDVALHGHTHLRVVEERDGVLVFNPGECAGHLEGHNAVGVLDLATRSPALLRF